MNQDLHTGGKGGGVSLNPIWDNEEDENSLKFEKSCWSFCFWVVFNTFPAILRANFTTIALLAISLLSSLGAMWKPLLPTYSSLYGSGNRFLLPQPRKEKGGEGRGKRG